MSAPRVTVVRAHGCSCTPVALLGGDYVCPACQRRDRPLPVELDVEERPLYRVPRPRPVKAPTAG